eukprot:7957031-Pyramimonas_sp.AAC.1
MLDPSALLSRHRGLRASPRADGPGALRLSSPGTGLPPLRPQGKMLEGRFAPRMTNDDVLQVIVNATEHPGCASRARQNRTMADAAHS